jgi:hypothetical protein
MVLQNFNLSQNCLGYGMSILRKQLYSATQCLFLSLIYCKLQGKNVKFPSKNFGSKFFYPKCSYKSKVKITFAVKALVSGIGCNNVSLFLLKICILFYYNKIFRFVKKLENRVTKTI